MKKLLAIAIVLAFISQASTDYVFGALSYSGGNVTQDFNGLKTTTGSPSTAFNLGSAGWGLVYTSANSNYNAGTGSSNTGAFYSFGTDGSPERALGSVASGSHTGSITFSLVNDSTTAFDNFTLNFDGEQWRNGGNATAQSLVLEYGFGSNYATVSWTAPGLGYDFTSPIHTASGGALDGNQAANRISDLGGTITANWAVGETLWIRWNDINDGGNDHGLAIDNVSFSGSVAAVPEPASMLLASIAGMTGGYGVWRRRKSKNASI